MTSKIEIAKTVFTIAIGLGSTMIVNDAIAACSPILRKSSVVRVFCVGVTGVVLADMMADHLAGYANNKIDEFVEAVKKGGEKNV